MKSKLIILLILVSTLLFSCSEPGKTIDTNIVLQNSGKSYNIKSVTINDYGDIIYVVLPADSTELLPVQSSIKQYKNPVVTTVILK